MIGFWIGPACIGMHIAEIAEASWVSDVIKEIKNSFFYSSTFYNFLAIRASQLLPVASLYRIEWSIQGSFMVSSL